MNSFNETIGPSSYRLEAIVVDFTPFIRFGRHGNLFARANNPFKNPVIMADEAAVFIPAKKSVFDTPFIGRAVNGVSKVEPRTVVQGYSIYLPINMENTR